MLWDSLVSTHRLVEKSQVTDSVLAPHHGSWPPRCSISHFSELTGFSYEIFLGWRYAAVLGIDFLYPGTVLCASRVGEASSIYP